MILCAFVQIHALTVRWGHAWGRGGLGSWENVIGCFGTVSGEGLVLGGWAVGEGERCSILGNFLGHGQAKNKKRLVRN